MVNLPLRTVVNLPQFYPVYANASRRGALNAISMLHGSISFNILLSCSGSRSIEGVCIQVNWEDMASGRWLMLVSVVVLVSLLQESVAPRVRSSRRRWKWKPIRYRLRAQQANEVSDDAASRGGNTVVTTQQTSTTTPRSCKPICMQGWKNQWFLK